MGYYAEKADARWEVPVYKVVEVTSVTEDMLEETLNDWTSKGWRFEGMQFAMRESSKRPAMAFLLFTRDGKDGGDA